MINGKLQITKDISLGVIFQGLIVVATALGFWFGLSARLDVLEAKLEARTADIAEIRAKVNRIEDKLFEYPRPR